jgi:hypothetical protein
MIPLLVKNSPILDTRVLVEGLALSLALIFVLQSLSQSELTDDNDHDDKSQTENNDDTDSTMLKTAVDDSTLLKTAVQADHTEFKQPLSTSDKKNTPKSTRKSQCTQNCEQKQDDY